MLNIKTFFVFSNDLVFKRYNLKNKIIALQTLTPPPFNVMCTGHERLTLVMFVFSTSCTLLFIYLGVFFDCTDVNNTESPKNAIQLFTIYSL